MGRPMQGRDLLHGHARLESRNELPRSKYSEPEKLKALIIVMLLRLVLNVITKTKIGNSFPILVVGIVVGLGLSYLMIVLGVGASSMSIIGVFSVATLIGVAGASVYLVVQLIADKELSVLRNLLEQKYVGNSLVFSLFLLSGGLVAGMAQASVGSFEPGHIWTSFLIGFGWQGVISGVGGSAAVRAKDSEGQMALQDLASNWKGEMLKVREELTQKIRGLQKQLEVAAEGTPPTPGESLGTVVAEGEQS